MGKKEILSHWEEDVFFASGSTAHRLSKFFFFVSHIGKKCKLLTRAWEKLVNNLKNELNTLSKSYIRNVRGRV